LDAHENPFVNKKSQRPSDSRVPQAWRRINSAP